MTCAILLACHGPKELTAKTVAELKKFLPQGNGESYHLFVVDDACPEKSGHAAKEAWGNWEATLIELKTPHFWAKSMAEAERAAKRYGEEKGRKWDYTLWINQDTTPKGPLGHLFNKEEIRVGECECQGHIAKGGLCQDGNPCRLKVANGKDKITTFNGNLVVIPERIGKNLSIQGFQHAFADIDYGLRATAIGATISSAGPLATTRPQGKNWRDQATFHARLEACLHPTGLPPKDWLKFCAGHGGPLWPLRFLASYRFLLHKRKKETAVVTPREKK